jgi:hypothetical protein
VSFVRGMDQVDLDGTCHRSFSARHLRGRSSSRVTFIVDFGMAVENSKVLKAAQKERIGRGRDGRVMEHAERGSWTGGIFCGYYEIVEMGSVQ